MYIYDVYGTNMLNIYKSTVSPMWINKYQDIYLSRSYISVSSKASKFTNVRKKTKYNSWISNFLGLHVIDQN